MKHARLFITAAAVLAVDRLTKLLWRDAAFGVIPRVLAFHGTKNTGMAFGLLSGRPWLLALLSAAACAGGAFFLRGRKLSRLCQYGLGLLLGGALGNLLDRVFLGYVIDFIDPIFLNWFICNAADIAITCGAALLTIHLLFGKEDKRE
ncbi:MAG: signal peptidase II [Clostridia bacterium]|nr:signal peptidase II [Clostridia bacterium]